MFVYNCVTCDLLLKKTFLIFPSKKATAAKKNPNKADSVKSYASNANTHVMATGKVNSQVQIQIHRACNIKKSIISVATTRVFSLSKQKSIFDKTLQIQYHYFKIPQL